MRGVSECARRTQSQPIEIGLALECGQTARKQRGVGRKADRAARHAVLPGEFRADFEILDRVPDQAGRKLDFLAIGDPQTVMRSPEVVEVYLGSTFDMGEAAS